MHLRNQLLVIVVCSVVMGCSNNDVVVKKQMELEARLEQLAQGSVTANARITELSNEVKDLQGKVKAASAEIEILKPGYIEFKASIDSLYQKVSALTPPPAVPKIEVVNKEAAPADKDSVPQDAYMKAFGLFSSDNYAAAIEAFEAFIKAYPDNEYAGNALYWIGECYYTQHDYSRAMDTFGKVTTEYPKGNKVPDAMLKIGFSFISMNEPAKARDVLQSLVAKYPKSQAAAKARERLGRL